ncbi:MAG: NADH-quinone oxidoreductase subunit D [Coriobacteriia bacterium]|nr:NADH-quinone oxidoreductase subunit D [Coriobacteriia bacterium]
MEPVLRDFDLDGMTNDQFVGYDNQGWLSKEPPAGIPVPRNLRRIADDPNKMSTEHFLLNVGPSHPSTHGALREILELNGESVMSSEAHVGYLHRGIEKLCESRPYTHLAPLMDRADYAGGILPETALAHAVENLAEIEVPERAQWLRAIAAEVNRIASHFLWLGPLGLDSGAMGPFLYMVRDRETLQEILESLTGQRVMFNYVRPGGVFGDMTPDAEAKLRKWLKEADQRMDEHWDILAASELFQQRVKGIGVVSKEMALSMGATGFVARASGIDWDLRRDRPYGPYSKLDFDVKIAQDGDIWSRVVVRYDEFRQSIRMLRQLLDGLPEGPYMAKLPRVLHVPKGESYGCVEGCRGEIGIHIYSDGGTKPYRVRYRPPILYHLAMADTLLPGGMIADAIVTMASFDFCFGEVDR